VDAWHILSTLGVGSLGALIFLQLVANELEVVSSTIRAVRRIEERRGSRGVVEPQAEPAVVASFVEKSA